MTRRRAIDVAMCLCFALAVAAVTLRVVRQLDAERPHDGAWALVDFRDAAYFPSLAFLRGANPYDAAAQLRDYPVASTFPLYSPLTLVLHAPLALLPLWLAQAVHYSCTVMLFPLIAWTVLRLCGWRPTLAAVFGIAAAMVLSRPGQSTLFLGQYAALMTAAFYATLLVAPRHPIAAGCVLALTTLKPSFGVPCLVLLSVAGMWRTVATAVIVAGAATAAPLAILLVRAGGAQAFAQLLADAHRMFLNAGLNHVVLSVTRLDVGALLGRLSGWPESAWSDAAIAACVLGIAAAALWRRHDRLAPSVDPLRVSVLCAGVLLPVYHQAYDALLLTLPLVALVVAVRRRRLALGAALLVALPLSVPAWNYLGSFSALEALQLGDAARAVVISLNGVGLSVGFVAAAILLSLRPRALRRLARGGTWPRAAAAASVRGGWAP